MVLFDIYRDIGSCKVLAKSIWSLVDSLYLRLGLCSGIAGRHGVGCDTLVNHVLIQLLEECVLVFDLFRLLDRDANLRYFCQHRSLGNGLLSTTT